MPNKSYIILPEYQGLGIAQRTIKLVESIYSQANGWILYTALQEERNCHLYEKMGYIQSDELNVVNENLSFVWETQPLE